MGLVIQNERICYTAPHEVEKPLPYVVSTGSINKSDIRTITFTATEDDVYQLYVYWTNSSATIALTDIAVKINNVAITLTFAPVDGRPFAYGEINLSTGDVVTISNTISESNRGVIAFLLKNADISKFEVVGATGNDGSTFPIGHQTHVLECYQYSFYNNATRYNYMIVADVVNSIATPSGSSTYYYGGTWAIRV